MINRLIKIGITPITTNNSEIINNYKYTVKDYVSTFLAGLGDTQKNRFKQMLENGIKSGMSVAKSYGIDYEEFITEVKKQLKI